VSDTVAFVIEIESEGEAQNCEIGGAVLDAASIKSRACASLSPDEARALAAVLAEHADFLGAYRSEIAASEEPLSRESWCPIWTR